MVTATRREARAGRVLAGVLAACLALVLIAWLTRRGIEVRSADSGSGDLRQEVAQAVLEIAGTNSGASPDARELAADVPAPAAPPAPARLTGRLQVNGYAASRGKVRLRSGSGDFERQLAVDAGGRFYCESVPPGPLFLGFEADGHFERALLLPDRFELVARPGQLEVLDLDWWTRQVNLVVHSEDGWSGPTWVELRGPGYDTRVKVDESGLARLDVVGQGIFTFRTTTPRGLEAEAELELESGDDLDTAVLVARIKKH